ncbi:gamma-sarcoglycan-like isoform X2 [Varroa jacobsoni]|nr:gamma-sarcoglycan-like isoform X2 [Varroa destructor]XP_022655614.1 gamma-sarcoglycan-like isoform X2 [Varroa destructor]XP_022708391.1 gamma-sarcoglycan-like isoform X2 [Varroa jacobsoni]XP_022708392.1 gamma-sarcoglycan-like isoform X2 [Varroa jacobsoni]
MTPGDHEFALQAFSGANELVSGFHRMPREGALKRNVVLVQRENGRMSHAVELQRTCQYSFGIPLTPAPSVFDGLVIDIRGWRKRYLLMLLIALSWLVALNLLLTLWISRAINFSLATGAPSVAIKANSLRANDIVNFLDDIAVKNIHSRIDEPIFILSQINITLSSAARTRNVSSTSYMSIAPDRINVLAESFSIHSADGKLIFQARDQQPSASSSQAITTVTHTLRIIGRGGVRFEDGVSLQTPVVAWGDSGGLRIESATRELRVEGPRRVSIESSEARVILEANQNLTFTSSQGKVVLCAGSIYLEKLRSPLASKAGKAYGGVYQLCVCTSGRLFLASPAASCRTHNPDLCTKALMRSSTS